MMNTKFVVWGAGKRGVRIKNIFPDNSIVAYIDADSSKVGDKIDEVPVISLEDYIASYSDYIIIISVYFPQYIDQVLVKLHEHNIKSYFILNEDSSMIINTTKYSVEQNFEKVYGLHLNKKYILYGLNITSVLLQQYFNKNGIEVILVNEDKNEQQMADISSKINSRVYQLKDVCIDEFDELISFVNNYNEIKHKFENKIMVSDGLSWWGRYKDFYNSKIAKFKDVNKGKRGFIVGTGPSLKMEDLDTLYNNNEICISMNGIYHSKDMTKWRPNYFVSIDGNVIKKSSKDFLEYDAPNKFISYDDSLEEIYDNAPDVYRIYYDAFLSLNREVGFSEDLCHGIYSCSNVTYACFQLAVYLGLKEIYLIGVDHNAEIDIKHFVPDYIGGKLNDDFRFYEKMNLYEYKLYNLEKDKWKDTAFTAFKKFADNHGIKIYNATRGGKLEIFERVDFDSLF